MLLRTNLIANNTKKKRIKEYATNCYDTKDNKEKVKYFVIEISRILQEKLQAYAQNC